MGNWLGRTFSLVLFVVAVAWAAPAAQAEDVFLIVSVDLEFDTTLEESGEWEEGYDPGSPVLVVRIGSLTNNAPDPRGTEFVPDDGTPSVPLGNLGLDELDGNESTIFGSFTVEEFVSEEEDPAIVPHMVTPGAAAIHPDIQAAVFAASAEIAYLAGGSSSTGEIVNIVKGSLGEGFTSEEVAEALFGATEPLAVTGSGDDLSCEAEGELLPHQPDDEGPIFAFGISFDNGGALSTGVFLPADVEVKESSINLKKKGTVSVAIYDSDEVDTDDIVEVEIHGVLADKIHLAKNKATAQFDVQELVKYDGLTSNTTEVLVIITLSDDTVRAGIAEVNVK
jgi:hypothetical protein